MMSGPRRANAQVKVKLGGMTASFIVARCNQLTLEAATGVDDMRGGLGLPQSGVETTSGLTHSLPDLLGVEATFKDVTVDTRMGATLKAEPAEIKEKITASFILAVEFDERRSKTITLKNYDSMEEERKLSRRRVKSFRVG
jgi:hypothetical protein